MHVDVEKCDLFNLHPGTSTDEYFTWTPGRDGEWFPNRESPKPRPRPEYPRHMFLCTIEEYSLIADVSAASEAVCTTVCNFIGSTRADKVDHEALNQACLYLALVAHKDLN